MVQCRECSGFDGYHEAGCTRGNEQPIPIKSDRPYIQDLVIADIEGRRELGVKRYGTGLQAFNGRNAVKDAYEECLDLACYLRQVLEEQDTP